MRRRPYMYLLLTREESDSNRLDERQKISQENVPQTTTGSPKPLQISPQRAAKRMTTTTLSNPFFLFNHPSHSLPTAHPAAIALFRLPIRQTDTGYRRVVPGPSLLTLDLANSEVPCPGSLSTTPHLPTNSRYFILAITEHSHSISVATH